MKTLSCLSILLLGASASAFAGTPNNGSMTLAGLKAKCVELSANEQLKPFKAIVTCNQVATVWRPGAEAADTIKVQNVKQIGASFSLKGYAVPFQMEAVEVQPSEAACSVLQQFKLTVPAVDIELDCAALAQVETIAALCSPVIEERVTADPTIQIEEPTGETFNTCSGH